MGLASLVAFGNHTSVMMWMNLGESGRNHYLWFPYLVSSAAPAVLHTCEWSFEHQLTTNICRVANSSWFDWTFSVLALKVLWPRNLSRQTQMVGYHRLMLESSQHEQKEHHSSSTQISHPQNHQLINGWFLFKPFSFGIICCAAEVK